MAGKARQNQQTIFDRLVESKAANNLTVITIRCCVRCGGHYDLTKIREILVDVTTHFPRVALIICSLASISKIAEIAEMLSTLSPGLQNQIFVKQLDCHRVNLLSFVHPREQGLQKAADFVVNFTAKSLANLHI